jgi:Helix-turn-helix domain
VAETLRKGTRVTGSDRSELANNLKNRYDSGESIRALANATGRSYGFIHRLLTETGVELRGRGGATRGSASRNSAPGNSAPGKSASRDGGAAREKAVASQ